MSDQPHAKHTDAEPPKTPSSAPAVLVEEARKAINELLDRSVLMRAAEGKPDAEEATAEVVLEAVALREESLCALPGSMQSFRYTTSWRMRRVPGPPPWL